MTTFSFLHAADLHLDTPFQGIAAESPEIRELLVNASLTCWDSLVSFAIERQVTFVLLAGDLYDGAERGIRAQIRVHAGLERLSGAGIRTFIVHGNHDPLNEQLASGPPPERVTVFGHNEVQAVSIELQGKIVATVYGISFDRPNVQENLALRFHRGVQEGIHIGLLHAMVGEDPDHGRYSPCSVDDLRAVNMDYWALGHVHKRQTLFRKNPWIVYPGDLQGRSSKPSEQGEKGAVLVAVHDGVIGTPEFVPLDRVRFVACAVDIGNVADIGQLRDAIHTVLNELRAHHSGRDLIARLFLRGRGSVHRALGRLDAIKELRDSLREECADYHPRLWIESIRDETGLLLDRDSILKRGDFSSELLLAVDTLSANEDTLRQIVDEEWAGSLRKELTALGVQWTGDDLKAILKRAESLALDLLEGEPLV